MRYFTADTHFFHKNVIKYCNRPFNDILEMNKIIINNWNNKVNETDDAFIIGDFAFTSPQEMKAILKKLKGRKHLIIGNHDENSWGDYIECGFSSVSRYMYISIPPFGPVGLAHDPAVCIIDRQHPWLVGHLHQQFLRMNNAINVGVDVRGFAPVSEEELHEDLKITISGHMSLPKDVKKYFTQI